MSLTLHWGRFASAAAAALSVILLAGPVGAEGLFSSRRIPPPAPEAPPAALLKELARTQGMSTVVTASGADSLFERLRPHAVAVNEEQLRAEWLEPFLGHCLPRFMDTGCDEFFERDLRAGVKQARQRLRGRHLIFGLSDFNNAAALLEPYDFEKKAFGLRLRGNLCAQDGGCLVLRQPGPRGKKLTSWLETVLTVPVRDERLARALVGKRDEFTGHIGNAELLLQLVEPSTGPGGLRPEKNEVEIRLIAVRVTVEKPGVGEATSEDEESDAQAEAGAPWVLVEYFFGGDVAPPAPAR